MKFKNYQCPKCNCNNIYKKEKQTHIGLYCSNCDSWIKWISKDESQLFDTLLKERKNNNQKAKTKNIKNKKILIQNNDIIINYLYVQLDEIINQNCISQVEMLIKSAKIEVLHNSIDFIKNINNNLYIYNKGDNIEI